MVNKIKAVILGHAVGDALGVPVEFCSREELKENPVTGMQGFGSYSVPAGAWSDDTSMSLCALESLTRGEINYNDIMQNFGKWYYEDAFTPTGEMFDVGTTCSFAIHNYHKVGCGFRDCGLDEEKANGNGSLMRIHPFVLYAISKGYDKKQLLEIVMKGSSLTHAHKRAIIGCVIYAHVLNHLIDNPSKESIYNGVDVARQQIELIMSKPLGGTMNDMTHLVEMTYYNNLFSHKIHTMEEEDIRSTGYVVDTLEAALWCLLTTDNYKDCVLKAVNLGDDTDTVAAVAGGLAGALYSYDAIPKEWLDTLIKRDYIEDMCERASKSWSKE